MTFQKLPWFIETGPDYAVSVVQIDYLLLVGGLDAGDVANPDNVGIQGVEETLTFRAISHMTA